MSSSEALSSTIEGRRAVAIGAAVARRQDHRDVHRAWQDALLAEGGGRGWQEEGRFLDCLRCFAICNRCSRFGYGGVSPFIPFH